MQPDLAFVQALRGVPLSLNDRPTLDADHLFMLASRRVIELEPMEKRKQSPDDLSVLALRGLVKLTAEDKQKLPPDYLFILALRGVGDRREGMPPSPSVRRSFDLCSECSK